VTVSRRERARAATRRCAEQLKLLRAYYDDAVTLPVLKTEQHRLANQIEAINARIDAHHGDYANAKAELDDTLDLLANAAGIYERGAPCASALVLGFTPMTERGSNETRSPCTRRFCRRFGVGARVSQSAPSRS
jgi:hypothetical protein